MAPGQQASAVDMAVEGVEDVEEEGLEAATTTEAAGVADTAMTTRTTDAVVDGSTASGHMWRDCYKLPDGWTPAQGQEGKGAGGGRGRGRGGHGGRGGGAAMPYNPRQNGMAEWFNWTLQEGARTLLGRAGLPDPFWVTALQQVALVKNRVLATVGDKQWVS
ncbi:unnamed protein product [Closterium sp. NIES-53]